MNVKKYIFAFFLLLPLQVLLVNTLGREYYYFDLFLIYSLFLAYHLDAIPLIYATAGVGIMKDLISGNVIGVSGMVFPIIAIIFWLGANRLNLVRIRTSFASVFFLSIGANLLISLLNLIFSINNIYFNFLEYIYSGLGNGIIFALLIAYPRLTQRRKGYVSR